MGCSNEKMVQVAPQPSAESKDAEHKALSNKQRAPGSAVSKGSNRSVDSAFVEGDTDSIRSASAKSRPVSGKQPSQLYSLAVTVTVSVIHKALNITDQVCKFTF